MLEGSERGRRVGGGIGKVRWSGRMRGEWIGSERGVEWG